MIIEYEDVKAMTETQKDSIEDSIGTIAETLYGTAPFIRDMGIKDYPPKSESETDRNKYATEVITQCGLWEDRVDVSSVTFKDKNVRVVVKNGGD